MYAYGHESMCLCIYLFMRVCMYMYIVMDVFRYMHEYVFVFMLVAAFTATLDGNLVCICPGYTLFPQELRAISM